MPTINERMAEALAALGKKQAQVAKDLGISTAAVSQLLTGKTKPSRQTATAFCDAYGVSLQWLQTGEGPMLQQLSREEELATYVARMIKGDDAFQRALVEVILTRTPEELATLRRMFEALAEGLQK